MKKYSRSIGTAVFLLLASSAYAVDPVSLSTATTEAPRPEKRFFRAAGETLIIGWSPWVFSHYVKDYPYADISMDTVRRNFNNPPWWDADNFHTNMWGHP